ncbi:MAG: hypothetical protein R6V49_06790 [Bacteroidales bacterium]
MTYQVMTLFSFEAIRLEFAKWAYLRTFDQNYCQGEQGYQLRIKCA